jgi:succinate dehydrogenase / fumarate reductase cytochrome b subunit
MIRKRPLSPHLQIYKIQITSLLSILHRGTGIVLFGGAVLCTLWFVALAAGPESYGSMQSFLLHPIGLIILLGWSFSFFFHLCNGIRHMFWDMGVGFDLPTVRRTGWIVVFSSCFLTGFSWILVIFCGKMWS